MESNEEGKLFCLIFYLALRWRQRRFFSVPLESPFRMGDFYFRLKKCLYSLFEGLSFAGGLFKIAALGRLQPAVPCFSRTVSR